MTILSYRNCTAADSELLARLNQALIRDEGHRNKMTLDELGQRMRSWLHGEYEAIVFESGPEIIGYILFSRAPEEVYVRQFFIEASRRRKGLGRRAIQWLAANIWNEAPRIRLDVLVGNMAGREFWKSVGFTEYCITMERQNPLAQPAQT